MFGGVESAKWEKHVREYGGGVHILLLNCIGKSCPVGVLTQ
jgi:hypothetical protein